MADSQGMAWASISVRVPLPIRHHSETFGEPPGVRVGRITSGLRDAGKVARARRQPSAFHPVEVVRTKFDRFLLADKAVRSSLAAPGFLVEGLNEVGLPLVRSVGNEAGVRRYGIDFQTPAALAFTPGPVNSFEVVETLDPSFFTILSAQNQSLNLQEFPIDFVVRPVPLSGEGPDTVSEEVDASAGGQKKNDDGAVAVDMAAALAHRRWHLFAPDLARRTYQITLPPGVFVNAGVELIGVPIITTIRRPTRGQFRRTLAISLILIPRPSGSSAQALSLDDWRRLLTFSDLSMAHSAVISQSGVSALTLVPSPLVTYLAGLSPSSPSVANLEQTLGEWIRLIARPVVFALATLASAKEDDTLAAAMEQDLLAAAALGVRRGAMLLLPNIENRNIHAWLRGDSLPAETTKPIDDAFRALGIRTADPRAAFVPTSITLQSDEYLYYFPERRLLVAMLPADWEQFPRRSLRFLLAACLGMTNGLSTVRTIAYFFHHEVENVRRSRRLSELTTEFVTDLDEAYDLDLNIPGYKVAYEHVKERSLVERDFEHVKWSVDTLSERISAEETRRSAISVLFFTITIAVGTLALVFTGEKHELGIAAIVSAVVAAWVVLGRNSLKRL